MRILPLGGAHEVGASSTIVDFGTARVLVDAGVRIGSNTRDPLPDLALIQEEAGSIDAIFLTHAHLDHTGALPLVHLAFPNVPIYMTPATFAVVQILFSDSLNIMEQRRQQESEIPMYPPAAVASCLGRVKPIPFDYPVVVKAGELSATFHPAGHILGAASIVFNGRSGSLMMSGDISVTEQRTVPGMLPPSSIRPDVVVVESTYGGRLHANRPTQERRLVETVAEVLEADGKVLIPSFAVGRAQEVILILQQAMESGQLPSFPIYVDGMVRSVCNAYNRFPSYLQQPLRQTLRRGQNLFFPSGGEVIAVKHQKQRDSVIEGEACCIISSSGMLTGGPSAYYASHLVDNPRNLIAITGYQDEESPGRKLLDLYDTPAQQRTLKIGEKVVAVRCKVEKYSLSAHADSGEIAGMIGSLSPSQGVVLVHGDREAREALATMMDGVIRCNILLPTNGEDLRFRQGRKVFLSAPQRRNESRARIAPVSQTLTRSSLSHLHQALWSESQSKGLYRALDLYQRWYGPNSVPQEGELEELETWLREEKRLFEEDARRPHMFRLRSTTQKVLRPKSRNDGRVEMNKAFQRTTQLFPRESGLYKKGARQEENKLLLFFRFPSVAETKYAEKLKELEQDTGWSVELNKMPHHASLEEAAREIVPEKWSLFRNPSIQHEKSNVRLRLYTTEESHKTEVFAQMQEDFENKTGYTLELEDLGSEPQREQTQPTVKAEEPLEINRAYQAIDDRFRDKAQKPYKKSKKGDTIVLSFLSPVVGQRYESLIQELSVSIGWPLRINPESNQYGIRQEVRGLVPTEWGLLREPGVLKQHQIVRISLQHEPAREQLEEIAEQIFERTGFHLEIQQPS
jgi:Cft2 family RNA processing exonuclease